MKRVENENVKKRFIEKYSINDIFSEDMDKYMECIMFKKGEFIFKENEDLNYLYFFVKGKLKVYRTLKNGKLSLLSFYYPFMVMGDLELVNHEKADANVLVIDEAFCIGLNYNKVRKILLDDSKFLRFVCDSLGKKLKQTGTNSSINILYALENRLASYIVTTSEIYKNNIIFKENLTELSELLGTSYRHLLRTLKGFSEKGYIKKVDNYYKVLNMESLTDMSSDLYKEFRN